MPELNGTILKNSSNLKAYYRFTAGSLLVDSSVTGATLTNNNTVAEGTGLFDGGADFGTGNTNKSLTVANALGIDGGAITISLWVKPNAEISSGTWYLASQFNDTSKVGHEIQYDYNSGTRRIVFERNRRGVGSTVQDLAITLGTTSFTHVVYTYDGTNMRGYVNGRALPPTSASGNGTVTFGSAGGLNIGARTWANGNYSNTIIDDVAVFNTALSADQIKELYEGRIYGELRPNQFGTTVGLWHLNGNSTDFSGNNNHGTDTAITYSQANGKFVQGAGFNGSTSRIVVGTGASLQFNKPMTCMAWVKTTYKAVTQTIYNNGSKWAVGVTTNGYPFYYTDGLIVFSAAVDITAMGWVHLAVVDESNTSHKIYLNGNVIGTSTTNDTTNLSSASSKTIGATATPNEYFNGQIDEVMVSSTALTANQIRQIYAYQKGLLGRYA